MSNLLPVKKIYCDTFYKRADSKSTSNFKIDLPVTLRLPDNCIFQIDDVSIPNSFRTIETGINDKLYFRISDPSFVLPDYLYLDYIITLDSKTYTGTQFAAAIQAKITTITSGTATSAVFDSNTNLMSVSVTNLDLKFFTDDELKSNALVWGGTPFDTNSLTTANELITNMDTPSPVGNTALPLKCFLMLTPVRNLYMRSPNLSSFNTIAPDGSASIIKKIPVNAAPGQMITSNITSSTDYLDCSRATWKTIEIILTDVHGNEISLHNLNWSFSIVFGISNPNI
jgi:hypothetical protein